MSASSSLHAPTGTDAPHPANNDGDARTNAGLRAHEQDDEKQPAQSSTHVSPAMRVYRHALESILAMLSLHDLTQILAVSRSWSAAVRSMKAIGATIDRDEVSLKSEGKLFRPLPPISSLVTGPLLRHLAVIRVMVEKHGLSFPAPLTSESLALLAQHAPNLTSLSCDLTLTRPAAPLILPVSLSSLELTLGDEYAGAKINAVLISLAALPSLSRLCLTVQTVDGVDVSFLAASRTLSDFSLRRCGAAYCDLSDVQVGQIRSSLGHLQRIDLGMILIPDLLQPPVTAQWQDIGCVDADARPGDLLVALPTLTRLDLEYGGDAPHADFLSKLPLLSALTLYCRWSIPPAPLLASLLPCIGLTELDLNCGFNSSQVGALLAALAKLKRLTLRGQLESLQCFASGPATLEELILVRRAPHLPPSELVHLCALQGLRSLELYRVFESLNDPAFASLTPPTARLPRLTRLMNIGEGYDTREEHTGPSFEWMQQRLAR